MTNHTPPPGIDKMLEALTFYEDSGYNICYDCMDNRFLEDSVDGTVAIGTKAKESLTAYNPDDWEKLQYAIGGLVFAQRAYLNNEMTAEQVAHTVGALLEKLPQSFKDWALGGGNK